MKIGIYESKEELKKAIFRYAIANEIYTHDIDLIIEDKDGAYILDIREEN